jgi:hypothetical protein
VNGYVISVIRCSVRSFGETSTRALRDFGASAFGDRCPVARGRNLSTHFSRGAKNVEIAEPHARAGAWGWICGFQSMDRCGPGRLSLNRRRGLSAKMPNHRFCTQGAANVRGAAGGRGWKCTRPARGGHAAQLDRTPAELRKFLFSPLDCRFTIVCSSTYTVT